MRTSLYYGSQESEIAYYEKKGYLADKLELCTILRSPQQVNGSGRVYFEALAFGGKRAKPDFHYTFSTVERREKYIADYIDGQKRNAQRKIQARANRTPSNQAAAAAAIRAELKAKFPGVSFRVTSKGYSMGDHVNIDWMDGPTSKSVDEIVGKYEMGHFDGMNDIYEYSNRRGDIPQSKYVFTAREMSDKVRQELTAKLAEYWGLDMTDEQAVMSKTGRWPDQLVRIEFSDNAY